MHYQAPSAQPELKVRLTGLSTPGLRATHPLRFRYLLKAPPAPPQIPLHAGPGPALPSFGPTSEFVLRSRRPRPTPLQAPPYGGSWLHPALFESHPA